MADASVQAVDFAAFLYGGLLIGILYELISFLRRRLYNRFFLFALDLLFVSAGSVVFALTFYRINGGVFRLFGILGILTGVALIRFTLGHYLRKSFKKTAAISARRGTDGENRVR